MNGVRLANVWLGFGILALLLWVDISFGETFHLEMIHKYSQEFRSIMQEMNAGRVTTDWPSEGTQEYYEKLIYHDRRRHAGRNLITNSGGSYSFAPTNETLSYESLAGLHYSLVTLGTPNSTFLVALDTGSDLLWVPCQCKECASTSEASYGLSSNGNFSVYNPSTSSTSKSVSCSNEICSNASSSVCNNVNQGCNYNVTYLSANTSTSGLLVQDLLYLNSENTKGGAISTMIYFGCSEVQTGDLLDGVAPNGLLGLGPLDISIPSTLARLGLLGSNSFSMCFSLLDTSGRLVFGSKGNASLQSTALVPIIPSLYYVIKATNIVVEDQTISFSSNIIFDTGTSITRLPTSTYQALGAIFNNKINLPTSQLNGTFEYCWSISNSNDLNALPTLSIVFSGGSTLTIQDPYVAIVTSTNTIAFVCLGIIEDSTTSIIAHNFMGGYEFFFDNGAMSLSWALSNCYNSNGSVGISPQGSPIDIGFTPPSSRASPSPSQGKINNTSNVTKSLQVNILISLICILSIMITYWDR